MSTDVGPDRRERILQAASRHFASTDYDKVSTVAIAVEADVNRGWIYHEFGSKRDLYLAVLNRTVLTPTLPMMTGILDSPDLRSSIAVVIDDWLKRIEANRDSYLALQPVHAGSHSDPVIRGILREMNETTIDTVLASVVRDPAQVMPATRALVACFGELAWQALWEWLESGRLDRDRVHLVLSRALMHLIELVPEVAQ
ncbi:TetR/AcrR family transcriptional regulator [Nocardioides sp. WS12]|uniref:TetR/AcrR family transcriptional regulator n=1 Tax=Nocardioides sp. WS12 TaxID=2486272 RepID=UPI0015FCD97F|nr:TetR/AcrR family transcriptional regulator [Nocardioides sp. WS12]